MSAATQVHLPDPKLCIGPAGWDYPDWQGVVYPPGLKGADRLTFLATLFTAMEINVTFYRPIPADYARRWLAAVDQNPDFRFTAKVCRSSPTARRLAGPGTGPVPGGARRSSPPANWGCSWPSSLIPSTTPKRIGRISWNSKPPSRIFPWPWRCVTAPGSTGP